VLGSLEPMPDDWSGYLRVDRCLGCVLPSPERIVGVLKRQKATGGFTVFLDIPLSQLRRDAMKARRKGQTISVDLPVVRRAKW
jgi:hypothetical protein